MQQDLKSWVDWCLWPELCSLTVGLLCCHATRNMLKQVYMRLYAYVPTHERPDVLVHAQLEAKSWFLVQFLA